MLAEPEVIQSEDTLWLGAMFPTQSDDEYVRAFGKASLQALDLARQDFMNVQGGLPPSTSNGKARPVPLPMILRFRAMTMRTRCMASGWGKALPTGPAS